MSPTDPRLQKSTNGRNQNLFGAALRALSFFAPAKAEEQAVRAFARPKRLSSKAPEAPGLTAHRFTLEASSQTLAAWDFGEGKTVLLVHGWSGQAAQMSSFIAPLVKAGFYVVAFDLPAHGDSTGEHANILDLASAILAVGRRVGPVSGVIAHSLGATAT